MNSVLSICCDCENWIIKASPLVLYATECRRKLFTYWNFGYCSSSREHILHESLATNLISCNIVENTEKCPSCHKLPTPWKYYEEGEGRRVMRVEKLQGKGRILNM